MANFTDKEIKEMLTKAHRKNQRYKKGLEQGGIYDFTHDKTVFDVSGIYDLDSGKRLTVNQFKEEYKYNLNYKLTIIKDMLSADYSRRLLRKYKDNLIRMAKTMGDNRTADEIEQLNTRDFRNKWKSKAYKHLKDKYETHQTMELIETLNDSGKKSALALQLDLEQDLLRQAERDILGY